MAHSPFSHMVVSNDPKAFMQTAYMIGSLHECRVYQMKHGLRASTIIVEG